jgi:hypothetical protein
MLQIPETITPEVLAFCQSIAPRSGPPVYVPVILEKGPRYLQPYRNVLAQIEATGVGQACTGWSIWEIPNVCLKAEHHCLWDGSDGRGPHDIGTYVLERRLLFLPDPAATFGPGQNEWPRAAYYTALQHDSLIFEYLGTMMMQEEFVREQLRPLDSLSSLSDDRQRMRYRILADEINRLEDAVFRKFGFVSQSGWAEAA